jgi:folate-binding protein YgfZ
MYGFFRIIKTDNSSFLLKCEPGIAETVIGTLNKYRVFFKCDLNPAPQYHCYGIVGAEQLTRIQPSVTPGKQPNQVTRIPNGFIITAINPKNPRYEFWSTQSINATTVPENRWALQEIQDGIPELYHSTGDRFIPQMLNLQELGAISFSKGCYTGQEIIARMRYLGTLKKKMYLLTAQGQSDLKPGADLYDEAGSKCGTVVRCADDGKQTWLLAVLNIEFASQGNQAFGPDKTGSPMTVSELQYPDSIGA